MRNSRRKTYILVYTVLIIGLIIFLTPYLYMIIASTQDNQTILGKGLDFTIGTHLEENWQYITTKFSYVMAFANSIIIAIISTALAVAGSTMAGYALAKYRFRGNKLVFTLIVISRMIPGFTTLIPLFYIMSKVGLTNTRIGIILPSACATTSVFIMRQYWMQFPTELMEAARIDGANEFKIFMRVAVPVLKPSIVTNTLLIFMGSWNSYLFPLVMLSDPKKFTIPLVIKNMLTVSMEPVNHGALMLVLATSVIPIILLYIFVQAKVKANDVGSAIK